MGVVIICPNLVHASKAPGNFGKLTRLVGKGLPFLLASIDNHRSFVGIDDLVDFIITCLEHLAAASETFLLSDGEDLSTPDLIRRMARSFSQKELGRGLLMDRLEELLHDAVDMFKQPKAMA